MELYFPKLYWVDVTDVILPVSVFCLSKPEVRGDINMHRGNGKRCLTLKGIYDMWPSPRYSAFCLLTVIFHLSWNSSEEKKKKKPAGDLCNSSGAQQTGQCLTTLSAVNQGSDWESQTRKEQLEVIRVILTCTGTVGVAAHMFYHFRQTLQNLDRKSIKPDLPTEWFWICLWVKVCFKWKFPSVNEPEVQEMWFPLTSFGYRRSVCLHGGFRSCCSGWK